MPERKKHTGLPLVTSETLETFYRDNGLIGKEFMHGNPARLHEWMAEICEENPNIMEYMQNTLKPFSSDAPARIRTYVAMLGVYRLLKAQAQANKLEEALGG